MKHSPIANLLLFIVGSMPMAMVTSAPLPDKLRAPKSPTRDSMTKIRWEAESGSLYYQAYLGIIYRTGYKGVSISLHEAKKWTTLSARKNHPLGLANLGAIALWESEGMQDIGARRKKIDAARQLYEDAYLNGLFRMAREGDPLAADLMGDYYYIGIPPNPVEAERFFRIAIAKGYPRSMAALGVDQMRDGGIPQNKKEAIFHLEKAAQQNLPVGLMNLGVAYQRGDGVPQNLSKAKALIGKAAERAHEPARKALLALDANQVPKPSTVGSQAPKPAPKPKVSSAPSVVSQLPVNLKGLDSATVHCVKAAQAGNAEAQRRLGLMFWVGKGVPQDMDKAKAWLTLAAGQGDAQAVKRLALLEKIY